LQKSLAVVCDGVEEGRKIFGNITKYILNTMSSNNGNMLTIAISSLFLPFIPLLPAQILLNNLLSDVPMLGISTDNVDASYRQRPRKWDIGLIVRFMIFFGAISTFFDFVLILAMRFLLHTPEDEFRTAWFLMSLLTEVAIVFSMRTRLPFFRSMPSLVLLGGSLFAAALGFFVISFAPIAVPFHFVPLSGTILALIFGTIAAYFIVNEIGKLVFFGRIEKEV
jgi:Mg2+-importing ATPase